MQTILGANGVIARHIALTLPQYTDKIRLVSRNPKKTNASDDVFSADLLKADEVNKAVQGSEVIYLVAGLQYNIQVWREQWPLIMKNVIVACKQYKAKLVFFDNVYALGVVDGWMTEQTPMRPSSTKGEVRKQIDEMILEAMAKGDIQAIIARAPDFYGPETPFGFINIMLFDNYIKGKSGQVIVSDKFRHSFIYTPDAGKATAILGNTPSAYDQVWNLPTDKNALTGKEFATLAAQALNAKPSYMTLAKWMIWMYGFFDANVKEIYEMLYQYDRDYLFDSSKFEKAFNFKPTTYQDGIKATAASMGAKK